jgi:hypothetical protein
MKEAPSSSETLLLTRATQHNIPEDVILHSHRRENLKPYGDIFTFLLLLYVTNIGGDKNIWKLNGVVMRFKIEIRI